MNNKQWFFRLKSIVFIVCMVVALAGCSGGGGGGSGTDPLPSSSLTVTNGGGGTGGSLTSSNTVFGPIDLVVTSVTLIPSNPAPSMTFTATVTVANQGASSFSVHAGYLDVWANQPASQVCGAMGDSYTSLGDIPGGSTATKVILLTAPSTLGPATFRAFVDSECDLLSEVRSNNQYTVTYTVEGNALPTP